MPPSSGLPDTFAHRIPGRQTVGLTIEIRFDIRRQVSEVITRINDLITTTPSFLEANLLPLTKPFTLKHRTVQHHYTLQNDYQESLKTQSRAGDIG